MHHKLVITPLIRIVNDQLIKVEAMAMNVTARYLVQKLVCLFVCLEDIEGGKFDVVNASAEDAPDKRFLQSRKSSSLVACVVDESHTVET